MDCQSDYKPLTLSGLREELNTRSRLFGSCCYILVAMLAGPALWAASRSAQPAELVSASHEMAFSTESPSLLDQLQIDALRVRNEADQLAVMTMQPELYTREAYGYQLENARYRVNRMDQDLLALRVNKDDVSTLQKKEIAEIAPAVLELTTSTQNAIVALRQNRGHVLAAHLDQYSKEMSHEANLVNPTSALC